MKSKQKNSHTYRKKRNFLKFCLLLAVVLTALLDKQFWIIALLPVLYLLHEIVAADHIFYNPRQDYQYAFEAEHCYTVLLKEGRISQVMSEAEAITDNKNQIITWLLPVTITSAFSGKIYDPYVEVHCNSYHNRQYFERGAAGKRYLDLSQAIGDDIHAVNRVSLRFKHCSAKEQISTLLKFISPNITKKRLLIIAPHADDAEIAAFGLYSQTDTHIVTITAGETEMEDYLHICPDPAEAAALKGRLRTLDSIAIPLWGNVPQERCIQLGYFCKQLQTMFRTPATPVKSLATHITDTRFFRQYNRYQLASDATGQPTWNNLIADLTEIIDHLDPEIILTPQLDIDPHPDHFYGTKAVKQALTKTRHQPQMMLYYANHYRTTDRFSFGPEHSIVGLPPHFDDPPKTSGVISLPLTLQQQRDKVCALKMMHDLRGRQKLKKRIRSQLQRVIGRKPNRYGKEDYLRKAIKSNELFYR